LLVKRESRPGGAILHILPAAASALPAVTRQDLERAWAAAGAPLPAGSFVFRFEAAGAAPVELALHDADAASWAAVVAQTVGLGTGYGVSLCLRLLGLVALLAHASWARPWFAVSRQGTEIDAALFQAVAMAPLTEAGGFDEPALRALLPGPTMLGATR
jgi:hypothetical protein